MSIKVFDFFSGCGGTSKGFALAGMDIVWAIDNDPFAATTFRKNFPGVHFEETDINEYPIQALETFIESFPDSPLLFSGCAPCQPFSKQNKQDNSKDSRKELLDQFGLFVTRYKPDYIFVENVPGIQRADPESESPFGRFLSLLDANGYHHTHQVVASQIYGVPQKRSRLVLIASKIGEVTFPTPTHGRGTPKPEYSTVREWIEHYPPIGVGETHPQIPNHQTAKLSELNQARIALTPIGGDRRDWPEHLQLDCHNEHAGHTDVYGRLAWDSIASCLTTKCTSLSNGRFGHPEQNRAISGREAASLQTFPDDFVFSGGTLAVARQVGNAVPVLLAQRFGEKFLEHLQLYSNEK